MKQKLNHLKNNPAFQSKLQEMKPKRNIWGVLGVILFFFVPEYLNFYYSKQMNAWVVNMLNNYSDENTKETLAWITSKVFDGEISFFNIAMGIALLVWIFWEDIKRMKERVD